jgi:hypothetical protein
VGGGSEADEQEAGVGIPERRDGFTPVRLVAVCSFALLRDERAVRAQFGTARARDDVALDAG